MSEMMFADDPITSVRKVLVRAWCWVGHLPLVTWFLIALLVRLLLLPFALPVEAGGGRGLVLDDFVARWSALYASSPATSRTLPLANGLVYNVLALLSPLTGPLPSFSIADLAAQKEWLRATSIFRQLFWQRAWYVPFDLATAWLLGLLARGDRCSGRLLTLAWLLNPLVLYSAYVQGELDVLPLFLVTLGLWRAREGRPVQALLAWSVGACVRSWVLLLILPAVLILGRGRRQRLGYLALGVGPYLVLLLPHLQEYGTWFANQAQIVFRPGYDLGFGSWVYLYFVAYTVVLWFIHDTNVHSYAHLQHYGFLVLLLYYPLGSFDLRYYAWALPLALLYAVEKPWVRYLYLFILGCLALYGLSLPAWYFLSPMSPHYFLRMPTPQEALSQALPIGFILSVFQSFLIGSCAWLIWEVIKSIQKVDHEQ